MKINKLDAHDRLEELHKQGDTISACCQNIIDQSPFGDYPFYIFAHKREIGLDERISIYTQSMAELGGKYKDLSEVPTHRIIWQPRLTKPKAQTNSMLFKVSPGSDEVKVIWMIPERELWDQYKKGNLTQHQIIIESIHDFEYDRVKLEAKESDDLSDEVIDSIYKQIRNETKYERI